MNHKPLISICIPTYNRAKPLEHLLGIVVPQAAALAGLVDIYVSDNGSTDNTKAVVEYFAKKYPELITCRENETNLGFDRNLLKVAEMAEGKFIWFLGDDDTVVESGVQKVADFLERKCDENTGLVILGTASNVAHGKPVMEKIKIRDVMGTGSDNSFLSVLVVNARFVKKILAEEPAAVAEATGNYFIHAFLYQLMSLKYPQLEAMKCNEIIVIGNPHHRKPLVEDEFAVFYAARKRLNNLLLRSPYMNGECRRVLESEQKKLKWILIKQMGAMKALGDFSYGSFFGCVNLFRATGFPDALFFLSVFIMLNITPVFLARGAYQLFLGIKYKSKWREVWRRNMEAAQTSQNARRITD